LGGRLQTPVPLGEIGITYHFRKSYAGDSIFNMPDKTDIPENRLGIDGKWDLGIGIWFEGTWIGKSRYNGILKNQEMLTIGADYTFGIGNGLNTIIENLFLAYDEKAFKFENIFSFTGSTLSYPLGISDQISAIVFYDWTNQNLYNR